MTHKSKRPIDYMTMYYVRRITKSITEGMREGVVVICRNAPHLKTIKLLIVTNKSKRHSDADHFASEKDEPKELRKEVGKELSEQRRSSSKSNAQTSTFINSVFFVLRYRMQSADQY